MMPASRAAKARPSRQPRRRRPVPLRRRMERWRKTGRKTARQAWRRLQALPPAVRTLGLLIVLLCVFAAANLVYQVVRKPSEMFFPVSGDFNKMPAQTWREYGALFRQYSTATITPELLAALAQIEAAGNPVARTYWRWQLTWRPFAIFKPASSAVGMFQMTDAAFADARHYCIRHHTVIEEGASGGSDTCWFNGLYTRVVPSHAIELTAVSLDRTVAAILAHRPGGARASLEQAQEVAVIAHLCGASPAREFAHRGFRLTPGERCGDHSAAAYLFQANAMKRQFLRLAAER